MFTKTGDPHPINVIDTINLESIDIDNIKQKLDALKVNSNNDLDIEKENDTLRNKDV